MAIIGLNSPSKSSWTSHELSEMVAMFAINVMGVYHLQPSTTLVGETLHFNLISGMPFNPKIKASSRLSQT
jgi:hypothetical protein